MNGIRHANTEELLALRDGEAAAWTKEHVEDLLLGAEDAASLVARLRS